MPGNRSGGLLNALWLIPIAALTYVGWMNLEPLGFTTTYIIDVGGEDTTGSARLAVALDSVSDRKDLDGTTFRELNGKLDLEVNSEALRNAKRIDLDVGFKDTQANHGRLLVGSIGENGQSYLWKPGYEPFYQDLSGLSLVAESATQQAFAVQEDDNASQVQTIDDFLRNIPGGKVVATDDTDLKLTRAITPEEAESHGPADFAFIDMPDALPDASGQFTWSLSIRGSHDFFLSSEGGPIQITVTKNDLNLYEGDDSLEIQVFSLNGTFEAGTLVPGDGDGAASMLPGKPQQGFLSANLQEGFYRLSLKAGGSNDLLVTGIGLNKGRLVGSGRIFLAGNLYTGVLPGPMTVYCQILEAGEIELTALHSGALQNVRLTGNGVDKTLTIDAVKAEVSTGPLEPGVYQIVSDKGDIVVEAPPGYFGETERSMFIPGSLPNEYSDGRLNINTALRGSATFWTYVANGSLELAVAKRDLNWYEDADSLTAEVYSLSGKMVGNLIIGDDGDIGADKRPGPMQTKSLVINGLPEGSYRIELKANDDLLVSNIQLNQRKLVASGRLWVIGMNPGYFRQSLVYDPLALFGESLKGADIGFLTYHDTGLQTVRLLSPDSSQTIEIAQVKTSFVASLEPGPFALAIPRQNLLINTRGYLSFTPDSFFFPMGSELIDLKQDMSWLKEHADYVVVKSKDYVSPVTDDSGWLVARTHWNSDDLFVKNNRTVFSIKASGEKDSGRGLPVDRIEIRISGQTFLDRLRLLWDGTK